MKFFWRMHNNVNSITDKPILEYEKFIKLYQGIIDSGNFNPIKIHKKNQQYMTIISIIFLLLTILIIYMLYQLTKKYSK